MHKKKIRGKGEYKVMRTFAFHPDALEAQDRMEKAFRASYGAAIRKQLVSWGLILLERKIRESGVRPGDDIEEAIGIQADQAGGRRVNGQATAK